MRGEVPKRKKGPSSSPAAEPKTKVQNHKEKKTLNPRNKSTNTIPLFPQISPQLL
jgi:hypothetical protein